MADDDDDMSISSLVETRTELDSHANMAIVGKHTCVLRDTGQRVDVNPFSPDFSALQDAKVVDAAVMHVDPRMGTESTLVILNALHVELTDHDLAPPFLMREAGIEVNDKAKTHCKNPTVDDHALCFAKGKEGADSG